MRVGCLLNLTKNLQVAIFVPGGTVTRANSFFPPEVFGSALLVFAPETVTLIFRVFGGFCPQELA